MRRVSIDGNNKTILMSRFGKRLIQIMILILSPVLSMTAQISPGDLASPHAHLEGISNCTKCHVLGNKVTSEKCLTCHTEIQERLTIQKGYHASSEVKAKECFECHNDHHGKNFQLIRLDTAKFDHNLTGYPLSIPHAKIACQDCHNIKFIKDQKIKTKNYTYLGLKQECLACHTDYHKNTLSAVCLNCHNPNAFKPATKFNHADTKFQLKGKHISVDCLKCHKVEITDGKKSQVFRLSQYACSSCHKDPHNLKFGLNCSQCHNEDSFQIVKGVKDFDHNKTDYKLEGKHLTVNCKDCHKTKFTDPLKFKLCTDCHTDYHKKQFAKNGVSPDCTQCHTLNGFTLFSYTIEQHNNSTYPLKGAHEAIPCNDCHKKQKEWNFKGIGLVCKDCHIDIHKTFIPAKNYPEANCTICHSENRWTEVLSFDHSKTDFSLTGAHKKIDCRECHLTIDSRGIVKRDANGIIVQKFSDLTKDCSGCHQDKHEKQFEKNGKTTCTECHDTENWKTIKFNHNNAAFKLDGKHINVPCIKCHKPQQVGSTIIVTYKIKDYKCESCHS